MTRATPTRMTGLAVLVTVGLAGCDGPEPVSNDVATEAVVSVPTSADPSTDHRVSGEHSSRESSPSSAASSATTSPGTATTAPVATATPQAAGDFCDDFAEFLRAWSASEFDPVELTQQYRSLADDAPPELADTLDFMVEANEILLESGNLDDVPGGQDAYDAAGTALQRVATDDCGLEMP